VLTPVNQAGDLSRYHQVQWKKDGSGFYLLTNFDREFTGVAIFKIADKSLRYLIRKDSDIEQILFDEDRHMLHCVLNDGGYSKHFVYDLKSGVELNEPVWPKSILSLQLLKNGQVLIAQIQSPKVPGDLWAWTADDDQVKRITRSNNAGVNLDSLVTPLAHIFAARDSLTLYGFMYSCSNQNANTPVIIHAQGGRQGSQDPFSTDSINTLSLKDIMSSV
jgi:dipeptidyl aminopeptidase/acylaminoacyl peptidase